MLRFVNFIFWEIKILSWEMFLFSYDSDNHVQKGNEDYNVNDKRPSRMLYHLEWYELKVFLEN